LLEEDEPSPPIPPRTLTPPLLLELDFWLLDEDFDEHDDSVLEEELAVIVMEVDIEDDDENEKDFI
jgi:hypothetical protein